MMGISRIAEIISLKGSKNPRRFARSAASSASVGGISGVVETDHKTDPIEQIAPTKKDPNTQCDPKTCKKTLR
jgi:hypothetical protein